MIELTQKKLRESTFFYGLLYKESQKTVGDTEVFEFYVSAFLSAARSVTFTLQYEANDRYQPWFNEWAKKNLDERDQSIWGFLKEQRNDSQKKGRLDIKSDITDIPFTDFVRRYPWNSGIEFQWFGPPGHEQPRTLAIKTHTFESLSEKNEASEICLQYLKGLEKMVADFLNDHQSADTP